ncbi:large ribosomal subunit protein eL22-like [Brachionichthys hirsutus]|uniref:large ribosomal subunit protein eL22-like n=1 Tax=Brachionichthys hirsutus TaxID=412623 RepID=UPI003604F91B
MGCSTSSQTSAVDTTRPNTKPEESNGASTTGAANENGKIAEDSETIPDQAPAQSSNVQPAEEPAATTTAAAPPAGGEPPPAAASPPAGASAPPEAAETAVSSSEPAAAPPEQEKAETTATDSGPKPESTPEKAETTATEPSTEGAPAPSE